MTRLALVSDDLDVERRIFQALGSVRFDALVVSCEHLANVEPQVAAKELAKLGADVAVIGPRIEVLQALCIAEAIDRDQPEITTVLLAEPTPDLWELALQAGCRYVLAPDEQSAQYQHVLDRALEAAERRRANIVIDLRDNAPAALAEDAPAGRIITVLSPKGGAGKTSIATNLAAGLARSAPDQVAIVDLDLQFGDVASALQLAPTHSLADLRLGVGGLDDAALKVLLTRHPEALWALCAPEDPALGEEIGGGCITEVLHRLADDLRYVVVDTGAGLDAAALAAVEASNDLVLVGAMDVPSVRSIRKLIDALDRIGLTGAHRHLVLNRANSKVGLRDEDVVDTLGMPITVAVPSTRSIPVSVNQGCPVLLSDPRSPAARPLQDLVEVFTGSSGGRQGALTWLRRSAR